MHWGGEIIVPEIPSFRITDLVEAIGPNCKSEIIGIRPGEKLHEQMISQSDSETTFKLDNKYLIFPPDTNLLDSFHENYKNQLKQVSKGFEYSSSSNKHFLTVKELREIIKLNVDSSFQPV